jgi:hypothetical protein
MSAVSTELGPRHWAPRTNAIDFPSGDTTGPESGDGLELMSRRPEPSVWMT